MRVSTGGSGSYAGTTSGALWKRSNSSPQVSENGDGRFGGSGVGPGAGASPETAVVNS
jgi:hypothetical protein